MAATTICLKDLSSPSRSSHIKGKMNGEIDDFTKDDLRSSMIRIVDSFIAKSESYNREPIVRSASRDDMTKFKSISIPGKPVDIHQVVQEAIEIFDCRLRMDHPRFMGFIPSPVSPVSWVGDCLSRAFNAIASSKLQASGPSVVEKTLIEWLGAKIGFGDGCGGVFVSGGSMANMMGIVMARDQKLQNGSYSNGIIYVTEQTHYSIIKATRILGFRQDQIHFVAMDSLCRMDPTDLDSSVQEHIRQGKTPFLVLATCGTTSTGAVDTFSALRSLCETYDLWLHVDGAFGASVALSASHTHVVDGLRHADSLSWDAHKWLFQTYSCGVLLTKRRKDLVGSFVNGGDYLRDGIGDEDEDIPNYWDYSMELTRPAARAMKLWFSMRVLGVEKIAEMVDHGMWQAKRAELELMSLPMWEIVSPATLGVVTFRFVPQSGVADADLDDLNNRISQELLRQNRVGVLTTKVRGRVVLRICAISPLADQHDLIEVVHSVNVMAKRVFAELQAKTNGR